MLKYQSEIKKLQQLSLELEKIHQLFPPQLLQVFSLVAKSGERGISVSELEHKGDLSKASASRLARKLSDRLTAKEEGLKLAEWVEDPNDMRVRYLRLNAAGKQFLDRLCDVITD